MRGAERVAIELARLSAEDLLQRGNASGAVLRALPVPCVPVLPPSRVLFDADAPTCGTA
jgi:hypothetical protein